MSLLNRFSAVIGTIENAEVLHDTGIMKQFIVKGLDGFSYILDIIQIDDEELLFTFTKTLEGERYNYNVSVKGLRITVLNKDVPALSNYIALLLSQYEYRFELDDAKRSELLQEFVDKQLEGYDAKYVKLNIDQSGNIKVEIEYPYLTRGLEVPYMLDDKVNVMGIDHMLQAMLEMEDELNHKIGDEENDENQRLADMVLDIGTFYELIVSLKGELVSKRGLN